MKNGILLLNRVFQITFIKIMCVHLHKDTIMNQFHIHDFYIIGLIFKAQIKLMRF